MSATQTTVMRPEPVFSRDSRKASAPSVKHTHMQGIEYLSEVVNAGFNGLARIDWPRAESSKWVMPKQSILAALRHALLGSWWEGRLPREHRIELLISREISNYREMQLIIASMDRHGHTQLIFERPVESALPDYSYAFDRIEVFENEVQGWDGADGLPASTDVANQVRKFLMAARKEDIQVPSLAMGGDGSVAVIWTDQNFYISADFDGTDDYSFFISEGDEFINDGVSASDKLDERLASYLKKYFTDDLHQNL
ncbi:hypothetical protein [Pseudomonas viridiflava]|uniref:hypothetical protein n=1 Tax=Pseudomonas viridiflava TaxID=33069 RepID=UPI0013CE5741|nr:hypothetical protein [Pseudomonas viridiflava]